MVRRVDGYTLHGDHEAVGGLIDDHAAGGAGHGDMKRLGVNESNRHHTVDVSGEVGEAVCQSTRHEYAERRGWRRRKCCRGGVD